MKFLLKIILTLLIALFFSCEEQGLIVRCPDCFTNEPKNVELEIDLELGYIGSSTLINVYEGNIEDSVLYTSTTFSGTYTTIEVSLNKKYTVTALYYKPDNYYTAVDSSTPRVKYEKSQCDEPCYFVYDKKVDLRLKYTK